MRLITDEKMKNVDILAKINTNLKKFLEGYKYVQRTRNTRLSE